jgi:hypothetical protein
MIFIDMKYIISESQLDKIMIKYLDSFLLDKDIINTQTSILVYDGDNLLFTYLPRPRELFTLEDFLDTFETMFNLTRPQALQFILGWFETQFGVTVRKSMTSF